MNSRQPGRWKVAVAGLLTALVPTARAQASPGFPDGKIIALGVAGLLAPSEVGAALATADRMVIGWSWQIPIGAGSLIEFPSRHRIVPSVDLLPHLGGASWRGRLGYRYGRRHAFAGAGVGADGAGATLSPELGVKFLHGGPAADGDMDPSLHLLARAEVAPETGHVRGATVLLGWNLF